MPQIRVSEENRSKLDDMRVSVKTYSDLPEGTRPSHNAVITKLIKDSETLKNIMDDTI